LVPWVTEGEQAPERSDTEPGRGQGEGSSLDLCPGAGGFRSCLALQQAVLDPAAK